MIFFIIALIIIIVLTYYRYFPVRGVQCFNTLKVNDDSIQIVDVRDYNQSYKDPVLKAMNIPVGYMKRYYQEISSVKIFVVASDNLEKNISIRFLRKKGFQVTGYMLTDCKKCKEQTRNGEEYSHGI